MIGSTVDSFTVKGNMGEKKKRTRMRFGSSRGYLGSSSWECRLELDLRLLAIDEITQKIQGKEKPRMET